MRADDRARELVEVGGCLSGQPAAHRVRRLDLVVDGGPDSNGPLRLHERHVDDDVLAVDPYLYRAAAVLEQGQGHRERAETQSADLLGRHPRLVAGIGLVRSRRHGHGDAVRRSDRRMCTALHPQAGMACTRRPVQKPVVIEDERSPFRQQGRDQRTGPLDVDRLDRGFGTQ
ncbi:MAG: hypothetical protein ACR2F6_08010 [Mycobacteriales bacterium]